jgi:hypothetical protein
VRSFPFAGNYSGHGYDYDRDVLDATMNYGAHISFAVKWAKILEKEEIESASM